MIVRHIYTRHGRAVSRLRDARLAALATQFRQKQVSFHSTQSDAIDHSFNNANRSTIEDHAMSSDVQSELVSTIRSDSSQNVKRFHDARQHHYHTTGKLGSDVTEVYRPHELLNNPPSPSEITLELLLASQAHLGHSTSLWNPGNAQYIFGIRQGIHIISLEHTASYLRRACQIVSGVAEKGGIILFVGTRRGQERVVVNAARRSAGYHLFTWWKPGTITNSQVVLRSCKTKAVDHLDRYMSEYDDQVQSRPPCLPDLVVCLNPLENRVLLQECGMTRIPTIGVIDTNADPSLVTYPIPANDDSARCIQVIGGVLGKAGEDGRNKRLQVASEGVFTFTPVTSLGPSDLSAVDKSELERLKKEDPLGLSHGI